MSRPVWQGSLQFGLVSIPVGLYPAESPDELNLDLLDQRNMARVGYSKVNKKTGEQVPEEELVKGYQVDSGRYVVVTAKDIKSASPEATRTIDIVEFVDASSIDPIYFDRPYYLAPQKQGEKPFALLRSALERSKRVGIARLVIRTREHVSAVYPWGKALVVHLLRYAHELRDPDQLPLPADSAVRSMRGKELEMAERLIEGMVDVWNPGEFKDEYRDKLLQMIEKKSKAGKKWKVPEAETAAPKAPVVDLMVLLKQSVEQQGKRGEKSGDRARPARARVARGSTLRKRSSGSSRRSA